MTEPVVEPVVDEQRDADAVGAPPYALPEDQGGSAAVVGHPDSPATLAASPVTPNEPVEPVVPGPDDAPVTPPVEPTEA